MDNKQADRVMENGRILIPNHTTPILICRGMSILTRTGNKAGFSAGVVVPLGAEEATHILLGRLPVTSEYRLIPVALIAQIDLGKEAIYLNIDCVAILQLPLHQPA